MPTVEHEGIAFDTVNGVVYHAAGGMDIGEIVSICEKQVVILNYLSGETRTYPSLEAAAYALASYIGE